MSQSSSKEPASPAKPSTSSNKRAASPDKTTSNKKATANPSKPPPSKIRAAKSKVLKAISEEPAEETIEADHARTSGKRVARGRPKKNAEEKSSQEEKPAKRARGRPKKTAVPVVVDRGTSP